MHNRNNLIIDINKNQLILKNGLNQHHKLNILILFVSMVIATAAAHGLSLKNYTREFKDSFQQIKGASDGEISSIILATDNKQATAEDIEFYRENRQLKRPISTTILNIFAFLFLFLLAPSLPIVFLLIPRSQPIVYDRERNAVFTVYRKDLYIGIINPSEIDYLLKGDGLKFKSSNSAHYNFTLYLASERNREYFHPFRCGSIPIQDLDSTYGPKVLRLIYSFWRGKLTKEKLNTIKLNNDGLDFIRKFFELSLRQTKDITRTKETLDRVDEFIKLNKQESSREAANKPFP